MNRPWYPLSLASIILLISCVSAFAQPNQDVAHWLDQDTTILINIPDVATTFEKIKSLEWFTNPRFIKAIQMLSDERFPIIDAESSEKIKLQLGELELLVHRVNQISFAVHDLDENQFHWSLFIRAESDVLDKIQNGMLGIGEQLKKTDKPVEMVGREEAPAETNRPPDKSGLADAHSDKIRRVGNWLIFSNHVSFLDALTDRIGNESFRSLGQSRKYQSIIKRESPLNGRDGLITIYGNPVRMRHLFPGATQADWDLWKIDELPACGLNLAIVDRSEEDQSHPIALADAVVQFTTPAAGWAKFFQFYRPVEIPPLAVEPIEFLAFSRDEAAACEEALKVNQAQDGKGAADMPWAELLKDLGLDNSTDVVSRRQAFYDMRFIGENQTADRPGLVSMEQLLDAKAAYRFAHGVTRLAQDRFGQQLDDDEAGSTVWWSIPAEQFSRNSGLAGFDRKRYFEAEFYNGYHDAYVLTGDWWIQGDMPAVREQVRLLTNGEGEDHGQSIRDLVKDLTRRLGADEPPLIIKYFTKNAWQENINNIEQQYANANARPVELKLKLVQGDGNNLVLELDPDEDGTGGISGGSFEIQLTDGQDDSQKGNDGQPPKQLHLSGLQRIQMMMPLRLVERNDDGYRIDLKRREDLETAIRVMIFKSISESFPRQLLLYARTDNQIRMMMGVYPAAQDTVNE
jgi:hypothetical protein